MDIETYRDYCFTKPGVSEGFPFDSQTLVFKVMGKMFALADVDQFVSVNLKCDPELAVQLREEFDGAITAGYHMSKKHWNTVLINDAVSDQKFRELIDHSYDLVVAGLTKVLKEELKNL